MIWYTETKFGKPVSKELLSKIMRAVRRIVTLGMKRQRQAR